ncbi:MAG: hypothetical protein SF187_28915 [Deltaproteobacteria bacterium]|nr:hypothetical protein [Deltaproteobacteria bacterium]
MRTNLETEAASEGANDKTAETAGAMTLEETAERLGLAPSTVRLRVAQGYLHPVVAKRQGQHASQESCFRAPRWNRRRRESID